MVASAHRPRARHLTLVGQRVDAWRPPARPCGAAADAATAARAGAAALVLALLAPPAREQLQPVRFETAVVVPRLLQGVLRRAARSSSPPQQRPQGAARPRGAELRLRFPARPSVRRLRRARSSGLGVRSCRPEARRDLDARAAGRPRGGSRRGDGAVRGRMCELPPAADGAATGMASDQPTVERRLEIEAPGAQRPLRHRCSDGVRLRGLR